MNRALSVSLARVAITSATLALASASFAAAGTLSPTITINGNVIANCISNVNQPSTIQYDPITANSSSGTDAGKTGANGSLVLNCTRNAPVTIDLGPGSNATGTTPNLVRTMLSAHNQAPNNVPDPLTYQIYSNSGYTTIWGTTSGGTSPVSVTGKGPGTGSNELTEPLYIVIPKGQNPAADTYVDTVTATITF